MVVRYARRIQIADALQHPRVPFYLVASLVLTWPLARNFGSQLPAVLTPYDALLHVFLLGWGWHGLTTHPLEVFNVPIFHPEVRTLTYMDHMLHSRRGEEEVVRSLSFLDGRSLWSRAYAVPFKQKPDARGYGRGPCSTPTVAAGRLCTLSVMSQLSVWKADSGELLWRVDYSKEFQRYRVGSSPLWSHAIVVAPGDRSWPDPGSTRRSADGLWMGEGVSKYILSSFCKFPFLPAARALKVEGART